MLGDIKLKNSENILELKLKNIQNDIVKIAKY